MALTSYKCTYLLIYLEEQEYKDIRKQEIELIRKEKVWKKALQQTLEIR